MKAMKIIALVCTGIFVVTLALGLVFAAAGEGILHVAGLYNDSDQSGWSRDSRTCGAENMKRLVIDADAFSIEVVRENREDILAEYSTSGIGWRTVDVSLDNSGGTVTLRSNYSMRFSIMNFGSRMTLHIPETFTGDMEVKLQAGSIRFDGKQTYGDVNMDIQAGTLQAGDMTAKKIKAEISAGAFKADSLTTEELEVSVGGGSTDLRGLTGKTKLDVGAGSARLDFEKVTGAIDADVSAGSAVIHLPENSAVTLDLQASMGSVSQGFGSRFSGEASSSRIKGKVNDGGHEIEGSVSAGSLTVKY